LQKANIGKVTFMRGNIPLEQYKETDFLTSFELTGNSSLNIRVFMGNSITNYMHQLAPELPLDVLVKSGNFQFSFFVDGKFIYKENIHYGCNYGAGRNKNTATTFRVPFTSITGEDWWAMYMWDRFTLNGGEEALTEGSHILKIELRPYVKIDETSEAKVGDLIAEGQLKLIIKTPEVSAKQIAIQPIGSKSGWEKSNSTYDRKKIEELNKKIAQKAFREITSIVVIKDGKLLIEEYFNDADRNTLHDTRSVGKSFTSALMGVAIKDGLIKNENQSLHSFYNLKQFENYSTIKDSVRLRDLLTMSSAFDGSDQRGDSPGNEEHMYPTDNWVKFTLDLKMDSTKTNGRQWDYFTAGVILLGDILNKSVPDGLEKYADRKLFKPLGILKYQWQYTPQKVANTAGGLQMSSLDLARFGQLYKNNGKWKGNQILQEGWIKSSFTNYFDQPGTETPGYGYLFWKGGYKVDTVDYDAFVCNGNGGNKIFIFTNQPLVIIVTAKAYNKPYAHKQVDKMMEQYILPALNH
jgi:CubicO group peptidase (beta-lactamase class C family)